MDKTRSLMIPEDQIRILERGLKVLRQSKLLKHPEVKQMHDAIDTHFKDVRLAHLTGKPRDLLEQAVEDTRFYYVLSKLIEEALIGTENEQKLKLQEVYTWYLKNKHVVHTAPRFGKRKKDAENIPPSTLSPAKLGFRAKEAKRALFKGHDVMQDIQDFTEMQRNLQGGQMIPSRPQSQMTQRSEETDQPTNFLPKLNNHGQKTAADHIIKIHQLQHGIQDVFERRDLFSKPLPDVREFVTHIKTKVVHHDDRLMDFKPPMDTSPEPHELLPVSSKPIPPRLPQPLAFRYNPHVMLADIAQVKASAVKAKEEAQKKKALLRKWNNFQDQLTNGQDVLGQMQHYGRSGVPGGVRYVAHERGIAPEQYTPAVLAMFSVATTAKEPRKKHADEYYITQHNLDEFYKMSENVYPYHDPRSPRPKTSSHSTMTAEREIEPPSESLHSVDTCEVDSAGALNRARGLGGEEEEDDDELDHGLVINNIVNMIDSVTEEMEYYKEKIVAEPFPGFYHPTITVDPDIRPSTATSSRMGTHARPPSPLDTDETDQHDQNRSKSSAAQMEHIDEHIVEQMARMKPEQCRTLYLSTDGEQLTSVTRSAGRTPTPLRPRTAPINLTKLRQHNMALMQASTQRVAGAASHNTRKFREDIATDAMSVRKLMDKTSLRSTRYRFLDEYAANRMDMASRQSTTPAVEFLSITTPKHLQTGSRANSRLGALTPISPGLLATSNTPAIDDDPDTYDSVDEPPLDVPDISDLHDDLEFMSDLEDDHAEDGEGQPSQSDIDEAAIRKSIDVDGLMNRWGQVDTVVDIAILSANHSEDGLGHQSNQQFYDGFVDRPSSSHEGQGQAESSGIHIDQMFSDMFSALNTDETETDSMSPRTKKTSPKAKKAADGKKTSTGNVNRNAAPGFEEYFEEDSMHPMNEDFRPEPVNSQPINAADKASRQESKQFISTDRAAQSRGEGVWRDSQDYQYIDGDDPALGYSGELVEDWVLDELRSSEARAGVDEYRACSAHSRVTFKEDLVHHSARSRSASPPKKSILSNTAESQSQRADVGLNIFQFGRSGSAGTGHTVSEPKARPSVRQLLTQYSTGSLLELRKAATIVHRGRTLSSAAAGRGVEEDQTKLVIEPTTVTGKRVRSAGTVPARARSASGRSMMIRRQNEMLRRAPVRTPTAPSIPSPYISRQQSSSPRQYQPQLEKSAQENKSPRHYLQKVGMLRSYANEKTDLLPPLSGTSGESLHKVLSISQKPVTDTTGHRAGSKASGEFPVTPVPTEYDTESEQFSRPSLSSPGHHDTPKVKVTRLHITHQTGGRPIPHYGRTYTPEEYNEAVSKQLQAKAAVSIQKFFRGYVARSNYKFLLKEERERHEDEQKAALHIQRAFRNHLKRTREIYNRKPDPSMVAWARDFKYTQMAAEAQRQEKAQELTKWHQKIKVEANEKLAIIGPHVEVYDPFHPKLFGPDHLMLYRAATCIQRWVRGWLLRVKLEALKRKAKQHAPSWQKFIGQYRSLLRRIQLRVGIQKPKTPINFDSLNSYMNSKKRYEGCFEARAFSGELEIVELMEYFNECNLYPSRAEVADTMDLIFKDPVFKKLDVSQQALSLLYEEYNMEGTKLKSGRGLLKHQVLEVTFQLYPPKKDLLPNHRTSTWMYPIVDGQEAGKLMGSDNVEPTDFKSVWNLVSNTLREKVEQQEAEDSNKTTDNKTEQPRQTPTEHSEKESPPEEMKTAKKAKKVTFVKTDKS